MVSENEGDDEEGDSKEHCDTSDEMDEMMDFLRDGSLARVQTRGQTGDAAHYLNAQYNLVFSSNCHQVRDIIF